MRVELNALNSKLGQLMIHQAGQFFSQTVTKCAENVQKISKVFKGIVWQSFENKDGNKVYQSAL